MASSTPAAAAAPTTAPIYTCPMHPQIRQPRPGNCPICGMTLEPMLPALDEGDDPELVDFRRRFCCNAAADRRRHGVGDDRASPRARC